MRTKLVALGLLLTVVLAVGSHLLDTTVGAVLAWALVIYALGPIRIIKFVAGVTIMVLAIGTCN